MSEISRLKKENKQLRALLKHSAALLERSTELLNAKTMPAPKAKKTPKTKAAKRA